MHGYAFGGESEKIKILKSEGVTFARNKIEDHIQEHYSNNGLSGYNFRYSPQGITSMQEAVKVLSPIAAARLLSFSLKQGLQETATRYEEAINRYQSQL